jgi:single-stranded DNA-binding protein
MNISIFILKITKDPTENFLKNQIKFLEIETSFSFFLEEKIYTEKFDLVLWGNLANNSLKLYRKGDYILVEGFLSITSKLEKDTLKKKIEITVLDIHPLF